MTSHPVCPVCRMEALRLVHRNGRTYCDWCLPGLGRPFNARLWPLFVARLDGRLDATLTDRIPRPTRLGTA